MLLPFGKLNLGFRKCIYYISVVNLINAVIKGRKKQLLRSLKCRLKTLIISAYVDFIYKFYLWKEKHIPWFGYNETTIEIFKWLNLFLIYL